MLYLSVTIAKKKILNQIVFSGLRNKLYSDRQEMSYYFSLDRLCPHL